MTKPCSVWWYSIKRNGHKLGKSKQPIGTFLVQHTLTHATGCDDSFSNGQLSDNSRVWSYYLFSHRVPLHTPPLPAHFLSFHSGLCQWPLSLCNLHQSSEKWTVWCGKWLQSLGLQSKCHVAVVSTSQKQDFWANSAPSKGSSVIALFFISANYSPLVSPKGRVFRTSCKIPVTRSVNGKLKKAITSFEWLSFLWITVNFVQKLAKKKNISAVTGLVLSISWPSPKHKLLFCLPHTNTNIVFFPAHLWAFNMDTLTTYAGRHAGQAATGKAAHPLFY